MSEEHTALHHFNNNVKLFLADLRHIFGPNDKELLLIEGVFDMTHINARLFIEPFQNYVSSNVEFITNILNNTTSFFIDYNFEVMIPDSRHSLQLLTKFRDATIERKDDIVTLHAIFNWFKVLIYYAYKDEGKDVAELATLAASPARAKCSTE
jgi:hypothetical protein